jgi:sugar lactone lactonase YvrE
MPVPEPVVRTVAGSGEYGAADGTLESASFMEPDGVAVAADGTLYVADGTANDIRALAHDTVRTVAGSPHGAAGFRDGPAASALFDRPFAIAVGKDGTIYVADSLNHRIRRIAGGVVTTLAGNATSGKADGVGSAASFMLPKGIAVDDDGNVYVADYGLGIRKIAPNGAVATMSVPNTGFVYSVAARGGGAGLILAYTDNEGIHIVSGGVHRGLPIGSDREPFAEGNRVGEAFGVAILDANSVVITDVWTHAVRYVNFNDPPFRPAPKTRTLAGGKRDGALAMGGYRDGASEIALVNSPRGLAYAPDGSILVADSGNRRIREISGLNPRLPIASNLSNLAFPPHSYRIALVGNSNLWNAVLWPESIGGVLEAELAAQQSALGIALKPSVQVLSASGGTLGSAIDFIKANFGDGEADLVILDYGEEAFNHEIGENPELGNGVWKRLFPARVRELARQLQRQGTKFALLTIPRDRDVSPTENSVAREYGKAPQAFDFAGNYRTGLDFENTFVDGQTRVIRILSTLAETDLRPDTPSLFNTFDPHITCQASIIIGRALVADLIAWKPWADMKARP